MRHWTREDYELHGYTERCQWCGQIGDTPCCSEYCYGRLRNDADAKGEWCHACDIDRATCGHRETPKRKKVTR